MLVLLVLIHPAFYIFSTSVEAKKLSHFHNQNQLKLDHVAGLIEVADRSKDLATKAARAAIYLATKVYETEVGGPLLDSLVSALQSLVSYVRVGPLSSLRTFNGSTFDGVPTGAQFALDKRYGDLEFWIQNIVQANESEKMILSEFCTENNQLETALCMLQVYGSIFGSNCSKPYSSLCPGNGTYYDKNDPWKVPSSIQGCVNERIARLSKSESALNQLAEYAKRNVFLAFNFIAFCSALNVSYDGFVTESVQLVRSIADGFAQSKEEIDSTSWPDLAKTVTAKTLTSAALKLLLDETDETYNRTAHDVVNELKRTWFSHDYYAVVYYSYTGPRKSDVVFYNSSKADSFHATAESTTAFVKRYKPEDATQGHINEQWKRVYVNPTTIAELFWYVRK